MKIKWYGHSCFALTNDAGFSIVTDPCDESTGYKLANIPADVVTSSHDHFDHNYFAAIQGEPLRITEPGEYEAGGVKIKGVSTWHDEEQGKLRGRNIVFVYEIDDLRIAHLGDLGHVPDAETIAAIGDVDVVIAPIGGTFTIEYHQACEVANALNANVFIPMHYQTPALAFDVQLLDVEPLLKTAKNCRIHRLNKSECTLTKASLGEARVLVLDYTR